MSRHWAHKEEKMRDISRGELEALIDNWIVGTHAERDRAILKRRLIDGLTYEHLADEFCLSERQVKTIVYKRQDVLFRHMPSE